MADRMRASEQRRHVRHLLHASLNDKAPENATEIISASILLPASVKLRSSQEETSEFNDGKPSTVDLNLTSSEVFEQLNVIEDSKSLNLQWTCLKSNDFLLKALEIDSRNILFGQNRNPSIPIFAANLGLLEPMKPTEASAQKFDATDSSESKNSTSESPQPSSPTQTDNIPPVQFDWSVSGLTNPLESLSSSTSILLDVDIFSCPNANVSSSVSKSSSLEDEFLSSPSPEQSMQVTSSSVLDKLMSSAKQTTYYPQGTGKKRPPGLSTEAIEVLDKLVPLSFMHAKVLMFPISKGSSNS